MTTSRTAPSHIYFIQEVDENGRWVGPIKIGKSIDHERRLNEFRTVIPRLDIRHLEPGGYQREAELHRRFAAYRQDGEWFTPAPPLLDYLAAAPQYDRGPGTGNGAQLARAVASPIVGAWRVVAAIVLKLLRLPAGRRKAHRIPLAAATAGATGAGVALAYLGQTYTGLAAAAAIILVALTVAGWDR